MKQITLLILTLFLVHFGVTAQIRFVKVNGEIRQFTIYEPSGMTDSVTVPLLLNFHGQGMTSGEQMMYSKTNELADQNGFIVVYPQGINNDWNVGFEQDYDSGTNDVAFIKTLIEKLDKYYPIDTSKVFAVGISRGGFFVQRLVAELPGTLNGIVSVGAPLPVEVRQRMPAEVAVKVLYVHGNRDDIVDIAGDEPHYLSLRETIAFWRGRHRAAVEPEERLFNAANDDGTMVRYVSYGGTPQTSMLLVENGGHTWPGADSFNIGLPLGETTRDIPFNSFIWDYLMDKHP